MKQMLRNHLELTAVDLTIYSHKRCVIVLRCRTVSANGWRPCTSTNSSSCAKADKVTTGAVHGRFGEDQGRIGAGSGACRRSIESILVDLGNSHECWEPISLFQACDFSDLNSWCRPEETDKGGAACFFTSEFTSEYRAHSN